MSELPPFIMVCQKQRIGVGISVIARSVPEIYVTSGLQSAILISGCRTTSGGVGDATVDTGLSKTKNRRWNFGDSFAFPRYILLPVCSPPF